MSGRAALLAAALSAAPAPHAPSPGGHAQGTATLMPCPTAQVDRGALELALNRALRPPPARQAPGPRWSALLPARVSLGGRDGIRAGLAWTESSTGPGERWTQYADRSIQFRVEWDLRDLYRWPEAELPRPQEGLDQLARAEQVAQRLAEPLRVLRRAQARAAVAFAGDGACEEAQADAEAAALVLGTVIRADAVRGDSPIALKK